MSLPYVGTLVNFNSKYLSSPVIRESSDIGYVVNDIGDYIRFIDKHGIAYIVPRSNVTSNYSGTNIVYNIVGPFYYDTTQSKDRSHLPQFLNFGIHS